MIRESEITSSLNLKTVECCNCPIVFAMPASLMRRRQEDGDWFYCPNGHYQRYTDSANDLLKRQVATLESRLSAKSEQARIADEARQKTEAAMLKMKKRTANGVCPCCDRSFVKLAQHMKTKHPNYVESK